MSKTRLQDPIIKAFPTLPKQTLRKVIPFLNSTIIRKIVEIIVNLLEGNISLKPDEYKKLCRKKQVLRKVANCVSQKTRKVNISQARKAMQLKNFVPILKHSFLQRL